MIFNFIVYLIYRRKNKLEKNNEISSFSNENSKAILNKGKCKESDITLNYDDDIIIDKKSIDKSK